MLPFSAAAVGPAESILQTSTFRWKATMSAAQQALSTVVALERLLALHTYAHGLLNHATMA